MISPSSPLWLASNSVQSFPHNGTPPHFPAPHYDQSLFGGLAGLELIERSRRRVAGAWGDARGHQRLHHPHSTLLTPPSSPRRRDPLRAQFTT